MRRIHSSREHETALFRAPKHAISALNKVLVLDSKLVAQFRERLIFCQILECKRKDSFMEFPDSHLIVHKCRFIAFKSIGAGRIHRDSFLFTIQRGE